MKNAAVKEAGTIVKYIISGGVSYVADILLFAFFEFLLLGVMGDTGIIASTILARIISTGCNYLLNSRLVFKAAGETAGEQAGRLGKFLALVCVQMMVSALAVYGLNFLFPEVNDVFIKVPVDLVLMGINYFIQRKFIFTR